MPTATRPTYWTHSGQHELLYHELHERLVPESGPAATPHGELLRAISKLYYDFYNNGCCNMDINLCHIRTVEFWVEWNMEPRLPRDTIFSFRRLLEEFRFHADSDGMYLETDSFDIADVLEKLTDECILMVASAEESQP